MDKNLYEVVLWIEKIPPAEMGNVKREFLAVTSMDSQIIETIFSQKKMTIKKGILYDHAAKYAEKFRATGMVCSIEPSPDSSDAPPQKPLKGKTPQTCPNCGYKRAGNSECPQCGIIFNKFKLKEKTPSPENVTLKDPDASNNTESLKKNNTFLRKVIGDAFQLLKNHLPENATHYTEKLQKLVTVFNTFKNSCTTYAQKMLDSTLDIIMYLIVTSLLSGLVFILLRMTWNGYMATQMGKSFVSISPDLAGTIAGIFSNSLLFPVEITVTVFIFCFAVCALCRFFYISRIIFHGDRFIGDFILCGLPLVLLSGLYLQTLYYFDSATAIGVAFIPTICLYHLCFDISNKLLPGMGDIAQILKTGKSRFIDYQLNYLREKFKK